MEQQQTVGNLQKEFLFRKKIKILKKKSHVFVQPAFVDFFWVFLNRKVLPIHLDFCNLFIGDNNRVIDICFFFLKKNN
jgi:hypothetical protein